MQFKNLINFKIIERIGFRLFKKNKLHNKKNQDKENLAKL